MNRIVLRKRSIVKGENMKERHKAAIKLNAIETLKSLNIGVGQDFHTLNSSQVDGLLREADRVRYQKPASANGSRGRYFHDRLQREARLNLSFESLRVYNS